MNRQVLATSLVVVVSAFVVTALLGAYAPAAQDHAQHGQTTQPAPQTGGGAGMEDSHSIF